MQIHGRRVDNGEPIRITVDGERIAAVEPAWPDAEWPYVAPGLFDLQINGHGGTWFSKAGITAEDVLKTLRPHFRFGITRLCPTIVTNSFEAIRDSFAAIDEACRREEWAARMVPGCHLEGPYLSAEDGPRGAHPLEHIRPADWEEFQTWQEASGNRIRVVTLAPEQEGAIAFIRRATETGIVVSIGHTAAEPHQIAEAVESGARLSTHLGNGAHGTLRRHPNYIWDQLGEDRLMASIIADGHHLPPSVVRTIVRTKGLERTILTCDASGLAGSPPGIYRDGSLDVEILEDGKIVLAGQRQLLAGSGFATDTCVANAAVFAGLSLPDAWQMASRNPARLLGFEEMRLRRSSRADLVLFDWNPAEPALSIRATLAAGRLQYGALPESQEN